MSLFSFITALFGKTDTRCLTPPYFNVILQERANDTGPAAATMVLNYHGVRKSLSDIRELLDPEDDGVNLLEMYQLFEKFGFAAEGIHVGGKHVPYLSSFVPCIAHTTTLDNRGHFVVVYAVDRRTITIVDTERGAMTIRHKPFMRRWTGYMLAIKPALNN